jgi:ankyrin repeat protein
MDIFIVKQRLKLMLWFVGVAFAAGLLGSWYAWTRVDLGDGREEFLMASVVTGALGLAWVVLLILFYSAKRAMLRGREAPIHWGDKIPWWALKCIVLLVFIGILAALLPRLSSQTKNEFALLKGGDLDRLAERIIEEPEVLERKERKSDKTLLELALESGQPEAVDVLLSNGAQLESLTNLQSHVLASFDNLPLLEMLLRHGADPCAVDDSGLALLFHAVEAGNTNALTALLEAGADVNPRDSRDQTPLLLSIMANDLRSTEILIRHNADLNLWDRAGETALHKAVQRRNLEASSFLLEKGADPRVFNLADMAPLHIAALHGQNELVELFLEQPDQLTLCNEDDRTAFDHALRGRKYETLQLLMDHGYNIDRVMNHGYTAVHLMVIARDYQAAQFLIEAGADVHIASPEGETAHALMKDKQLQALLDLVEARDNPVEMNGTNTVGSVTQP